jgi:hypothetical protein
MDIELWKSQKKKLNLTFQDLSVLTKVSVRTLKALFSGERLNTTTYTVDAIEKALGLKSEQPQEVSPKVKELVNLLMQFDDKALEDALSVIKIIAKK